MPKDFFSSVYKCSKYFSELQIEILENNIERFVQKIDNDIKALTDLQYCVAKTYVNRYKIKPINSSQEVVGQYKLQVLFMKKYFKIIGKMECGILIIILNLIGCYI